MRNGYAFPRIFGSRFFARQFDQVSGRFFNDLVGAGAEHSMFVTTKGMKVRLLTGLTCLYLAIFATSLSFMACSLFID